MYLNWDRQRAEQRWEAWWHCEMIDRPLIQIAVPNLNRTTNTALQQDENIPERKWHDSGHILRRNQTALENTVFMGEAVAVVNPDWSVGHACYFGCEPEFSKDTVWADPLPLANDGYPSVKFLPENPWLQWFDKFTEAADAANTGEYFLVPQFGNSAADTLAVIRGSEELMFDIIENPDWVRSSIDNITDTLLAVYSQIFEKIRPINGYANWNRCWAPGRAILVDADIGCMISPEQYKNLILPSTMRLMSCAEYTQYHLDGPGAITHLDTLLTLPELKSIQWVPGAGQENILQWVPLINRIVGSKKAIIVYAKPDEIIPLLKEVRPEGLCISTTCDATEQAERLLDQVGSLYQ